MPEHDFHSLSPVDFEDLTRDLLQVAEGIVFQTFKTGRDRGVDLRYAEDGENRIVQCKHYRKSGYDALLRSVRKEKAKIARLKPAPTRYILSTSVELSNANKEEIVNVLGLSNTSDILGGNDLNNLLGLHSEVEVRHYKLWLASTAVMQRVLHNAEAMQTDFEFRRIAREIPRFVQTKAYRQAADHLARDRIIVLSGLPGVGKSTIADFLLYEKFADGYQPVIARNGFDEARALYQQGVRQVFLYDDFLGATFLGEGGSALVHNEDRAITDFLNVIGDDQEKLLILTTREHILSEALETSERLRHSSVRDFRYVVRVGVYTAEQRAEILYNHAYFNGLDPGYIARLLADDFYFQIIDHPKFSPRVIEWMTTPRRVKVSAGVYQGFVLRLLDDPSEVWLHAYDQQLSQAARSALLALHSLNGQTSHDRLSEAFDTLHTVRAARYGFATAPGDFLRAMRVLSGSFVTITHNSVDFIDPSVRDLMNSILHDAPDNCLDIVRGAVSMMQVSMIWTLADTRDGEHIQARIEAALPSLVDGVRRALDADTYQAEGHALGVYTPVIETHLALIAEIARYLDNRALDPLVLPTGERALQIWQTQKPDIGMALHAIDLLGQYAIRPQPAIQGLRRRLISALVIQTRVDFEPSQMLKLLQLNDDPWTIKERSALGDMALRWTDIGDQLRACRSRYDLERLLEQLNGVAAKLDLDLHGSIQKVEVELRMFEPEDEREPPPPQWFDPRDELSDAERTAIRSLFATLRPLSDVDGDPLDEDRPWRLSDFLQ